MILELPHCTIRPWAAGDAAALVRHASDREVWRNLRDRFPYPYTEADARLWLAFIAEEPEPTHWAVEVDGEACGGIGFTPGEDVHARMAEIGYWLGRAVWNRGIATEALRAVTEYAFSRTGFDRLEAHVFAWNAASVRVLEKAGYVREGCLRRAVVKGDEVTDLLIYGILK